MHPTEVRGVVIGRRRGQLNSLLIIIIRRYMRLADRPIGLHTLAFFRTCLRIAGTTAKRDTLRAVNKYIN